MTEKQIQQEIKKLEGKIIKLRGELFQIKQNKLMECMGRKGCGKYTKVKNLTYIQTHWYESPRGCTDGDIWHEGEGQFVCPKCGRLNRSCWNKDNVEDFKKYFGKIEEVYKD